MCSLWGRRWELLSDLSERFAEGPAPGKGRSVFYGLVCAIPLAALGGLVLYYAIAYGKDWDWVVFAVPFLSTGLSLHFYYIWAPSRRFRAFGMVASRLSLLVLVLSIVCLMIHGLL